MRQITVQVGNADQVVEKFSQPGPVQEMEGFIDMTVMVKRTRREEEEDVILMARWESEEAWKKWEKSDIHIQGHRENRGKPTPEYVISSEHGIYDVKKVKGPITKTT